MKTETSVVGLAGAIAARLRERKTLYLQAVGVDPVANAIQGACKARQFLAVRASQYAGTDSARIDSVTTQSAHA